MAGGSTTSRSIGATSRPQDRCRTAPTTSRTASSVRRTALKKRRRWPPGSRSRPGRLPVPASSSAGATPTASITGAHALPFLYPELERSMRDADFRYNVEADGGMVFRLQLPLGRERVGFRQRPCPTVSSVASSRRIATGALKAGAEMGDHLGEPATAAEYPRGSDRGHDRAVAQSRKNRTGRVRRTGS